ncbi:MULTISPECIES: STAS-like domain-containing protein [Streptomyces]|uniref:STAS-like domain-containing protein n=1 Tax=Streptomyces TaxID=1883 RepID=UPI001924F384|nr:STAS-like domain-containing protein [Streptomyces silvae]MBL1286385.1 STAS-like domain-containing protein [Streptomyces silvae]
MAATLEYFREGGMRISTRRISPAVAKTRFLNPLSATPENIRQHHVGNVVWKYNEEQSTDLCNAFIDMLEENARCETGVIESLNWCLFEVLDNVFQHSKSPYGYAMMQIHARNRWCTVAVSDCGIGIHRSFKESNVHAAQNAYEAIMLSVQEKVTSKTKNMGNGLYGLMRVVGLNRGELQIRSGRGWLEYRDGEIKGDYSMSTPLIDLNDHHGTTVDWQLDLSRRVSLVEALNFPEPNLLLERIEDDMGEHSLRVADFEEGLGTRRSAEQIRNRLTNLLSLGARRLVLDFSGVYVVSSSFADEVLGKLALEMGIVTFMSHFDLREMTPTVSAIVNRAISQRIAEGDDRTPGLSGR